ncbi:MAG: glycoside hydrolase family 9 protein [Lachnospiraceae bacterium]|nr:glycoside hydrolase family 9 protein [Lachnospiraceae bacterium]
MAVFVNQLGYIPGCEKIAVSTKPCNFQLIRVSDQKSVFDGTTGEKIYDESTREDIYHIDFTPVDEEGEYYILAGNSNKSHNFRISEHVYKDLIVDVSRALYYQRCGIELDEAHAGIYSRPGCHKDEAITLEDFLKKNPDPKKYDMTGGWHDAGDYGRYSTAGAVAVAHILYAFDMFPESFGYGMNIPESGNGIPDILNECAYELRWLLKMQSKDGGVYHKLTGWKHAEFIMPEDDHDQFIIYPVSSLATADFVAIMALASRVYRPFMPEFAEEMFQAAIKSSRWLDTHPYYGFTNPEGSNTGEYGDESDLDERLWASAEMLRADPNNREKYLKILASLSKETTTKADFGWEDVSGFATISVLSDPKHSSGVIESSFKNDLQRAAFKFADNVKASGYQLGLKDDDFVWGSNMVVANRAILFIMAYLVLEGPSKDMFKRATLSHLHYLLGRNPLDVSYITGAGENAYLHPHSRVCAADGIDKPIPGFVSGGPFKTPYDEAAIAAIPKGTPPIKCYLDDEGSYSTNEITIYWNSPLVFILGFIHSNVFRA